jgi:hypothetical protein
VSTLFRIRDVLEVSAASFQAGRCREEAEVRTPGVLISGVAGSRIRSSISTGMRVERVMTW